MSSMTTPTAAEESKARESTNAGPEPKSLDALHTAYGDTTIADQVVEKIAVLQPVRFPASTPGFRRRAGILHHDAARAGPAAERPAG